MDNQWLESVFNLNIHPTVFQAEVVAITSVCSGYAQRGLQRYNCDDIFWIVRSSWKIGFTKTLTYFQTLNGWGSLACLNVHIIMIFNFRSDCVRGPIMISITDSVRCTKWLVKLWISWLLWNTMKFISCLRQQDLNNLLLE